MHSVHSSLCLLPLHSIYHNLCKLANTIWEMSGLQRKGAWARVRLRRLWRRRASSSWRRREEEECWEGRRGQGETVEISDVDGFRMRLLWMAPGVLLVSVTSFTSGGYSSIGLDKCWYNAVGDLGRSWNLTGTTSGRGSLTRRAG